MTFVMSAVQLILLMAYSGVIFTFSVDHSSAPEMTEIEWDDAWGSSSVETILDNLDDYEYSENTLSVIRGYVGSDNSPTSD